MVWSSKHLSTIFLLLFWKPILTVTENKHLFVIIIRLIFLNFLSSCVMMKYRKLKKLLANLIKQLQKKSYFTSWNHNLSIYQPVIWNSVVTANRNKKNYDICCLCGVSVLMEKVSNFEARDLWFESLRRV